MSMVAEMELKLKFQTYPRGVEVTRSWNRSPGRREFQTYPRGVEVGTIYPGLDKLVEFQTYPRGVEVTPCVKTAWCRLVSDVPSWG